MNTKLLYLDLIICSVWMLFVFGRYGGWAIPVAAICLPAVFYRFVLTFSLSKKEVRSWLPLLIYAPLSLWIVFGGYDISVSQIGDYFFHLTHIEHNDFAYGIIKIFFLFWLFALPYLCYLFLLIRKETLRTELTWPELIGAILWRDKHTKIISAILMLTLIAFITGLSMSAGACQLMCFSAVPITYWLVCRYKSFEAEKLWVLVIAMVIFWYAQTMFGVLRVLMLLISMGMVTYTGIVLNHKTKKRMMTVALVLYLGVLLPSFSIGYNQYACIQYARSGFHYLEPFRGILYIINSEGQYGLRDRYGLLIKPEYEVIRVGEKRTSYWSHQYMLQKDGYNRYYDVFNNKYVQEPDIIPDLQHKVRSIIEDYFASHVSEFEDKGQITVLDKDAKKTIANVQVSMKGNPVLCYEFDKSLGDSITITSAGLYRNDSVKVRYGNKHSIRYVKDVYRDSVRGYRIYVQLVTDSILQPESIVKIADNVAILDELK